VEELLIDMIAAGLALFIEWFVLRLIRRALPWTSPPEPTTTRRLTLIPPA
jgi:hypothetical protein